MTRRQKLPPRRRPVRLYWVPKPGMKIRGPSGELEVDALVYWHHKLRLFVCSSVSIALSGRGNACPHWHVSVSKKGAKATDEELAMVRRDFEMLEAEEDNHARYKKQVKGAAVLARHLWLAVPAEERVPCPCAEDDDQAIIEKASSPIDIEGERP